MKCDIEIPSNSILVIISTLTLLTTLLISSSIVSIPTVEAKYVFSKKWSIPGPEDGSDDIATDTLGNLYVTPAGNHTLHKFKLANPCPTGTTQVATGVCFVTKWGGSQGSGNAQFNSLFGVAVAPSGRVYVTDSGNNRIQEFRWFDDVSGGGGGGTTEPGIATNKTGK